MAYGHRLDAERPQLDGVPHSHLAQVGLAEDAMLLQFGFDEAEREPSPVDRDIELLQNVGQAADVVFVPMAQENAEHVLFPVHEVRDVGKDKVDAAHVLLRKHQARVDDEDLLFPLQRPHVDAVLAEAAQRQVSKSRSGHSRRSCSASCRGTGAGSGGGGGGRGLSRYTLTRSKSRSRSATRAPLWSAAAGWNSGTYATSPRFTRLPWMREIEPWPGISRSSAWRPRMRTTFGRMGRRWRARQGERASAS